MPTPFPANAEPETAWGPSWRRRDGLRRTMSSSRAPSRGDDNNSMKMQKKRNSDHWQDRRGTIFSGTGLYVRVRPEKGSRPLAGVAVAAFRKRRLSAPEDPTSSLYRTPRRHASSSLVSTRLPYTDQFRFLDKAAVVVSAKSKVDDVGGRAKDPWRLCNMGQAEEAKCILRVLRVWATCIVYYIAFAQTNTYVVLQAAQSDRRFGPRGFEVPPVSFTVFPMVALAVWIPVYDRLLVPWLRRLTGRDDGITLLQRMGVGMVLSVAAMLISSVAEQRRRELSVLHAAADGGGSLSRNRVLPASAFWLVPQLAALGLSEAFNQVGQMEFFIGAVNFFVFLVCAKW